MAVIAVLTIFAAMLLLAIVNARAALMVSVFFMPWNGLDIDIGLRITVYQLALAAIVIVMLARLTQPGLKPARIATWPMFATFVLYAVLWSLLQLGIFPQLRITTEGLRGPNARAIIQILLFLFAVSPVVVTPLLIDRRDDVMKMGRLFIAGAVVLSVIGWGQLALWYANGTNPLPIGAFGNALGGGYSEARSGSFALDALNIYRMNSLAGEPRDLGIAVIIAMLAVQGHALVTKRLAGGRLLAVWAFLFFTMLATLSTSAIGLWIIASAALLPACWLFRIRVERSGRQLAGLMVAIIVPLLLLISGLEAAGVPIIDILAERTVERLGSDGAIEDFDLAIISFLQASPGAAAAGVGLGNAHLYATPYLDPLYALYAEGNVFVAKTQYLRFISEIGIIGLSLFLGWYLWLTIETARCVRRADDCVTIIPAAAAVLVVAMGSFQAITMSYALAGAMAALCVMLRRPAETRVSAPLLPA